MPMTTVQITNARLILADPGTNCVQSVQIENAVGGTFTITYNGQTTVALAYNAGANAVQNALCALSNTGVGNLTVNENAGVPGSLFYVVYFTGALANIAVPMLTVNASGLTGAGVLAVVALVTAGGVTVFTDAELSAQHDLAKQNYFLAICYLFRVLLGNAAKFNRYTAGQSQEFKEQIFEHLQVMAETYQQWAQADRQVQFASLVPEPPRLRAVPWQAGVPSTSLVYGPPYGVRNGWRWPRGNW